MILRTANESDFDRVLELVNTAFSVERAFKNCDRLDREELGSHFRKGVFLVCEDETGQAGTQQGSPHQTRINGCVYVELRGDRAYFGLLSIDPAHQRAGLGRRLVSAAEEFAREMGARRMEMCVVNLRTELFPIYEKLGYATTRSEDLCGDMCGRFTQPAHFVYMEKELGHRS